jgi:hypothetical protein
MKEYRHKKDKYHMISLICGVQELISQMLRVEWLFLEAWESRGREAWRKVAQ